MDDFREVIAVDYEAIIEAASAKMRASQRGVRGQMITPQDDFSWWVMQEATDAALAAIKQAGFVVVPADELEGIKARYQWAVNELLACDYGDNPSNGNLVGWRVHGWRNRGAAHTIFGPSIDEAIDRIIRADHAMIEASNAPT